MHGQSANGCESKLQHGARWKKVAQGHHCPRRWKYCVHRCKHFPTPRDVCPPQKHVWPMPSLGQARPHGTALEVTRRATNLPSASAKYLRARACGSILAQPTEANAKALGKRPRSMVIKKHFGSLANNTIFTPTCFATCKSPASPDG